MRIAQAVVLAKAIRRHPDASGALRTWLAVVRDAEWRSIEDVRQTYPHADGVQVTSGGIVTIFNIRGNNYRLLTWVVYRTGTIAVIDLLTHAEYDKNRWSRRL